MSLENTDRIDPKQFAIVFNERDENDPQRYMMSSSFKSQSKVPF